MASVNGKLWQELGTYEACPACQCAHPGAYCPEPKRLNIGPGDHVYDLLMREHAETQLASVTAERDALKVRVGELEAELELARPLLDVARECWRAVREDHESRAIDRGRALRVAAGEYGHALRAREAERGGKP